MGRFRVTIGGLAAIVLLTAFAFAALLHGSAAWDRALFGAALLAVLTSILLAVHREGRARAFWLGFALFGGAYLVACQSPEVRSRLATTRALIELEKIRPTETIDLSKPDLSDPIDARERARFLRPDGSTRPGVTLGISPNGMLYGTMNGTSEHYFPIGHSLWAMIVGLAGGWISRQLQVTRRPATRPEGAGG